MAEEGSGEWQQARARGRARGRSRPTEQLAESMAQLSVDRPVTRPASQGQIHEPAPQERGGVSFAQAASRSADRPPGTLGRARGPPTHAVSRPSEVQPRPADVRPRSQEAAAAPARSSDSRPRPSEGGRGSLGGAGDHLPPARSESRTRDADGRPSRVASAGRGAVEASSVRGQMRGRRQIQDSELRPHTRPPHVHSKEGSEGRKIRLKANYFVLEEMTDWALLQYRVDFSPDDERTNVRKNLLKCHAERLGVYIFDGTVLFISHKLHPDPLEVFSMKDDQTKVRITIKRVGELQMGDHHYLQFFNIILRKCLAALNLQLVGRNFFDHMASVTINEHKMELWPGYLTSIRQHENHIMLCTEISHKVMRQDTALDLLLECISRNKNNHRDLFISSIIGSVVLTRYNNKTYRIDDVDFDHNPASDFALKDNTKISYMKYYKDKYSLKISNSTQPLLVSRARPKDIRAGMSSVIYLIPELCALTGLTDEMRANFQLMRALAEHTRVSPGSRISKLKAFNERLHSVPSIREELRLWNIRLGHDLVEFDGRVLNDETIVFGNNRLEVAREADWTRAIRGQSMLSIFPLNRWAVLYSSKNNNEVQPFIQALIKSAGGLRFNMPAPSTHQIAEEKCQTYVSAIDVLLAKTQPDLLMIILPNNRSERYSAVKKKCCVDRAVPTQVVVAKNLSGKGLMSIATKIAIQMSCKIGGVPWGVRMPHMSSGMMVIGYDVCHDTSNKGRSFGAMVASLDQPLSRYYSAASPHTSGEELSNDLSLNICKALTKYRAKNGHLPGLIVIYRDGVGEGQIPFVLYHEVKLIKEKLGTMYNDLPKFTFIIVTKRLNTRIFFNDRNPIPGTVVDSCITSPEKYDFFLVSQSVRQGTVSPTAYNVIEDTSGLTPDRLQRLTYKMTHLYFNWSGTVRVPAQCQYAHKLAFLVGQSLHRAPHPSLSDLLYFL